MLLLDVNILIYAHRKDASNHSAYSQWLSALINSDQAYGMSELVLSGFIRVATHSRIFDPPSLLDAALEFTDQIRNRDNCVLISPGPRHWDIFVRLCRQAGVKGNLVSDAYLAALAIESGSEWITTDRDYARFPGLRWRHPL
ncbi:MAG: type II toxin-antitoxin system VapC family toxin [Acidobacteriota bacterium]